MRGVLASVPCRPERDPPKNILPVVSAVMERLGFKSEKEVRKSFSPKFENRLQPIEDKWRTHEELNLKPSDP